MKTVKNKALVYDSECPLCAWYTGIFVKYGALEPEGRIAWNELPGKAQSKIDLRKARHEIALIDHTGGPTLYGIDSLIHIAGTVIPPAKPLLAFPPFRFLLRVLYSLISYNRRIIAGKENCKGACGCSPDFHFGWRSAFIALSLLAGLAAFFSLGSALGSGNAMAGAVFVCAACMGVFSLALDPRRQMDYLGHLATLLLVSTFFIVFGKWIWLLTGQIWLWAGIALAGYALVFRMHDRRLHVMNMSRSWNLAWMLATTISLLTWISFS